MSSLKIKRGSYAQLVAAAAADQLKEGEPYLITDQGRIAVGTSIQVTAGCDHSYSGANGCPKFANQRNFGGCPFVPGESNNVFVTGVK